MTGTVHQYAPERYVAPEAPIDDASGGGGFTNLWANGTVYTYWPLDADPLVYEPDPLRQISGPASTLEVLPAPDGNQTWLVQPGFDDYPTLIELVNVAEFGLARLMATELDGSWHPVGATVDGLVVATDDPEPATRLVGLDGDVEAEHEGSALSVGWNGAAVLRPDGSLIVTDSGLGNPIAVDKPGEGAWVSVGGPAVPTTSPPITTGTDRFLAMLAHDPDQGPLSSGDLVVIDASGTADSIYALSQGSQPHLASWSPHDGWIVVVEGSSVTLISLEDGSISPLGDLIPESHHVLSAG